MEEPLDKLDKAILNLLQKDSTLSIKDIGDKIGLSTTPTFERIKRLEKEGVIARYVALVDRKKVGLNLLAYCNIVLKDQSKGALQDFEKLVTKLPEVIEMISISGNYDYTLKIVAADIAMYNDFVRNTISTIPNVAQYHSSIVLHEVKKITAYKLL